MLSELGESALYVAVEDDSIAHFTAQELEERGVRRLSTRLNALLTEDTLGTDHPRKRQREEVFEESHDMQQSPSGARRVRNGASVVLPEIEDPTGPLRQEIQLRLDLSTLYDKGKITRNQAELAATFFRVGTKAEAAKLLGIPPATARQRLLRLAKKLQKES